MRNKQHVERNTMVCGEKNLSENGENPRTRANSKLNPNMTTTLTFKSKPQWPELLLSQVTPAS